jgi:hypothetical protein
MSFWNGDWMNPKLRAEYTRRAMNVWPCIAGTGGRIKELAPDYSRLVVELPCNWRTRNVMGTTFGGSLYASTDPFFVLLLRGRLGADYVVWDKGCTIRFKRPATVTLWAEFNVTPAMFASVQQSVAERGEAEFTWSVQYRDASGLVYAEFDKVLYVAHKDVYARKLKAREARVANAPPPA